MSSGTKYGRLGCEARTEGVVTGRVRLLHRDLGRLCAGRESRKYHYKGSRQQYHWYYASILGSLSCLPMMNGRSSFPSGKAFSASRKWGGMTAAGTIAVRLLRITNDCRLRSWGGSRLGAHANLDRARKGCVYVKVGIVVAVTGEVFVSNRQVDQASAETRKYKLGAALPC